MSAASPKARSIVSGLLPINKPVGMVSKDVSRWLTSRFKKLKIKAKMGHVGTLDPAAEGVLPILLGSATRLQDYLLDLPKTYEATAQLGRLTDTLDADGELVEERPWEHVTDELIKKFLLQFTGEITQVPPAYSAVKVAGKPLYRYARSDNLDEIDLETLQRKVFVHKFELIDYDSCTGVAKLRIECSKGTYIRVLIQDLAIRLNTVGSLISLVRTRSSGISISETYPLEEIDSRLDQFDSLITPIEALDVGLPRWKAEEEAWTGKLKNGQVLKMKLDVYGRALLNESRPLESTIGQPLLLLGHDGKAFGIGDVQAGSLGTLTLSMKRGL